MKILIRYPEILCCQIFDSNHRKETIRCAISTRDITRGMTRCRSSNMWGYTLNVRNKGDREGDLFIQFKGRNGGPDDIYIYYDVPIRLYRKLVTVPSKGHFFWQYIRNNYKYSKLTGNKRGVLPNAIN